MEIQFILMSRINIDSLLKNAFFVMVMDYYVWFVA